jgi:ABC-type antimicrobial peptide transport system, permease component
MCRREGSVSRAIVRVQTKETFDDLGTHMENKPSRELRALTEGEFRESQASGSELIKIFGQAVGYIRAVGATLAALNTRHSADSTRVVEIGTLLALGFKGSTVLVSLMIEAMILATIGGLLGAGIAYVLFNGYTVSTLAGGSFTQTAFAFAVTGDVIQQGMSLALTVGLIGGVFPAFNAARRDITEALRSI